MSLTIFLVCCVLGMDCLIYILFQWVFGEKYRGRARKIAARKAAANVQTSKPYLVSPRAPQARHATEREVA